MKIEFKEEYELWQEPDLVGDEDDFWIHRALIFEQMRLRIYELLREKPCKFSGDV